DFTGSYKPLKNHFFALLAGRASKTINKNSLAIIIEHNIFYDAIKKASLKLALKKCSPMSYVSY
ncbi:MAG: hypothetical protein ACK5ZT_15160, partial [Sphingobacteriaceae bacterium]